MSVKPIKPSETLSQKVEQIPDEVMSAFNELIAKNLFKRRSQFKQEDVVELILEKMKSKGITRNNIFENHWLDVEEIYRDAGWRVEYDKPGFNEGYAATFTFFEKKRKK